MIANLFELHEHARTMPRRAMPSACFRRRRELVHDFFVENRLLFREVTFRSHFGLIGQIGGDGGIGFEPP